MIVTHTTETVPMMNCGEWYVFARVGNNAWKCMTDQSYVEMINHDTKVTTNVFFIALGITAVIFLVVWLCNRD